jgi:hypothetical protein
VLSCSVAEDLACNVNIFAACILSGHDRLVQGVVVTDARQLHQHGQIEPGDHFNAAFLKKRYGEIGRCSAEHVGEENDALPRFDAGDGGGDVGPSFVHAIFRANANRLKVGLLSDHMLKRMYEFSSETTVSDDDKTDHAGDETSAMDMSKIKGILLRETLFTLAPITGQHFLSKPQERGPDTRGEALSLAVQTDKRNGHAKKHQLLIVNVWEARRFIGAHQIDDEL